MKPHIHAQNSANKYGGQAADYIKIHNWFDQTKAYIADHRHRALLHTAFGIFLCEQAFGETITNSDGNTVSVRDVGEDHVFEDFRGFIPTVQDFLELMPIKDWMINGNGTPPSVKKPEADLKSVYVKPDNILDDQLYPSNPTIPKFVTGLSEATPSGCQPQTSTTGRIPQSKDTIYFDGSNLRKIVDDSVTPIVPSGAFVWPPDRLFTGHPPITWKEGDLPFGRDYTIPISD